MEPNKQKVLTAEEENIFFEKLDDGTCVVSVSGRNRHNQPYMIQKVVAPLIFEVLKKADHRNKELEEGITKLQEKYDENGYDAPPLIKLSRVEAHIDAAFNIWKNENDQLQQQVKELRESLGNFYQYCYNHEWHMSGDYRARLLKSAEQALQSNTKP